MASILSLHILKYIHWEEYIMRNYVENWWLTIVAKLFDFQLQVCVASILSYYSNKTVKYVV